jgi:hypothetical protein
MTTADPRVDAYIAKVWAKKPAAKKMTQARPT